MTEQLAALLAAVEADPDELHTRMVYADALSEAGDPRGEFIALQCAGGNAEREHALLAAHGTEWLGRLAPFLDSTIYVCGFLHSSMQRASAAGNSHFSTPRSHAFLRVRYAASK